ncbi:hypothetical protein [Streptomyces kaniharaensis]|uniref:hypothetical protein n=1 Tax=Streptomyces kaniharaensis TaxID=212423 RepID=UPI0018A882B6|nr:hypothetical protein [Streptomyces kaniharaensis]
MDTDIAAMAYALREAATRIRENALPCARARRDEVGPGDEAALLGALAAMVENAGELAEALHDRMTTPDARAAYRWAGRRLREQAENLRVDERKVAANAARRQASRTP